MSLKELVEDKITGEPEEMERRKKIWENIFNAYEQGGINAIVSYLREEADDILEKFEIPQKQLEKKL